MKQTLVQKILAKACDKDSVGVGEVVEPRVSLAMSHENAALVINQFKEIFEGTNLPANVWDPDKIAIIFDHRVPAESKKTATNQKLIRQFIAEQKITKFHDIRGDEGGICHQILAENGYILPGGVVVGTDSHTTTHGALGAFAFGIGATEMASVWALGHVLNVEVPATIKVVIDGKMPVGVYPKDIILYLIGKLTNQGANYKVLEFHGSTIKNMDTSGRLTLSNMAVEAGATAGIFPPDDETVRYLREVANYKGEIDMIQPDSDAEYIQTININIESLEPQVAVPHNVDNVKPISQVEGIPIDQVVIGSCTNGRLDDLKVAADIIRGKKISRSTRMLVFPASGRIYQEALEKGYVEDFLKAGAVVMNSGCGPCLGVHQGALGDNERAFSTTNRNFKGRMGNPDSEVYLGSPATAAATALFGKITDPRKIYKGEL
ncbi:MAG: 3-isopropylmalate dehydratase large subunit [Candidatus Kapabacteria bacterium]|nr:3-isopropylmalate dehydratase large subunit [Candidatus Kapabacteria bacterium]